MILQRYVFRELLLHFLFTLVVVTGIFVVALGVQSLYRFSGFPLVVVVRAFPFFIPYSFTYTTPMALLVAVVLTFGRLSQDREILAIRASGVHLYTVIVPAILLGVLVSLGAFWVNDRLIPFANSRRRDMEKRALEQVVTDINTGKGGFPNLPLSNLSFNLSWERTLEDGTIQNPIFLQSSGGTDFKVMAERAWIQLTEDSDGSELLAITFESAYTMATAPPSAEPARQDDVKYVSGQFGSTTYAFPLDELLKLEKKPGDRKLSELMHLVRLRRGSKEGLPCKVEIHRRLGFSGACVALVLLGAPLGILFNRGGKLMALLVSFLVVMVVYYPLLMLGQALAEGETVPPWVGLWLADVVVASAGVFLLGWVFRQ